MFPKGSPSRKYLEDGHIVVGLRGRLVEVPNAFDVALAEMLGKDQK